MHVGFKSLEPRTLRRTQTGGVEGAERSERGAVGALSRGFAKAVFESIARKF